jgi:hypothetical protein
VTLAAAQADDAHSSWGKCEANSLLAGAGGQFDGKSLLLKSAAVGGLAFFEQLTGQKHPKFYRVFSVVNFGISGGLGAVAAHNYSIAPPARASSCIH